MLGFVTSVRHPDNSHDYAAVEALLGDTLRSWSRQDSDQWVGVIVANREPSFALPAQVRFVEVDFPPPSPVKGPRTGIPAVLRDKGTKLAVGLGVARSLGVSHVMFADADDFVSRRLASQVASDPDAPGWTVTHGWRYNAERSSVRKHDGDFHLQCGTSHIVRADLYPAPDLPGSPTQEELYDGYGDRLERWIGSHMHVHEDLPLAPLPFPGALYRVGHGEAHSGNSMGGLGRPVGRVVAAEFGVPRTGLLAAPRAVLPSTLALRARFGSSRERP